MSPTASDPPSETVADRFALRSRVAAGAMGEVFLAQDLRTGARIALKRMTPTRDAARFSDECAVLRRLAHPAIVAYVDHGTDADGRPWLAMEWLEGEDLATLLDRAVPTIDEALAWLRQIAEGLAAAHALGIVHRDMKPENVVLVPDPTSPGARRATIVDFGLARADVDRRAATRTGVILGTPAYMAPEQVRGVKDIDARADVFALGCIAFECLAGRPAFVAESLHATFAKIIFEDPPPLARVDPTIPGAVSDLVARMIAKPRAERPADAAAVLVELTALGETWAGRSTRPTPVPVTSSVLAATLPNDASAPPDEVLRAIAGPDAIEVIAVDDNHCVGCAFDVAILVWGRETTLAGVASCERAIRAHAARYPGGIGLVTVVEDIAEPPTAEVRKELARMLDTIGGRVRRSAVVSEGIGFRAAMVRGVVTGLTLFARLPYPHRVFATMETAFAWVVEGLSPYPGAVRDTAAVLSAARALRARFDAHRRR